MFQGTGGWYAKVALISGALGATMELFMIKTGFYEKVVDLEAQRRADELHAAKEGIGAVHNLQQPNLSNQPTSEQTVGPS